MSTDQAPLVVAIYADGQTEIGPGVTIATLLGALERVRASVMNMVVTPAEAPGVEAREESLA